MKLSTREDIAAPIETVFSAVTDFAAFERQMLRRGVDLQRDEMRPLDRPGAEWRTEVTWRGRPMRVDATLTEIEQDRGYTIESRSGGVICFATINLVKLSNARTRLFVSLEFKPTTLSSRLLVQSLKLAKRNLETRFEARVAEFARSVERTNAA